MPTKKKATSKPKATKAKKRRPTLAMITCAEHGKRPIASVCEHLAKKTGSGFHHGRVTRMNPWPDAWCDACERIYDANGRRWHASLHAKMSWAIICSGCYTTLGDR